MEKVVFFYPSHVTGGAEYLLKTAARLLSANYHIVIADVEGGWLSSNIQSNETLIFQVNEKIYLDEKCILITTANLVRNLDIYFTGDFRILSWVVQMFNVIPALPRIGGWQHKGYVKSLLRKTVLKSEYKYFKSQVLYLNEKRSIYVMDDGCKEVIKSYLEVDLVNYLPVVIPEYKIMNSIEEIKGIASDTIRLLWVGRLDGEFKNPILIKVIKDAISYSRRTSQKLIFDIVGDGPGMDEIQQVAKDEETIKFIFQGVRRGGELIDIIRNSTVGFSMGTSALEIAAQKKPTVLLDFSYNLVSEKYRYKWLYEEKNYSLGRLIEFSADPAMGNHYTFDDIISCLNLNSPAHAQKCYQHVKNYHSLQTLEGKLVNAINISTFSFAEAKESRIFKKPFWFPLKRTMRK